MPKSKTKYSLVRRIVFYINLIAGLALAGAILASYVPPSKIPFFSVLALMYPALVFINIAFVLFWIIIKSKWFLLSLIILLLGFTNLQDNFQFHLNNTVSTDTSQLKVLTYNVRLFRIADLVRSLNHQKNFRQLKDSAIAREMKNFKEFITGQKADIVCLQEFYSEGNTQYGPLEKLKTELNFSNYYYESYFGPGPYNTLTGMVIFSKFPAVNSGKLKLRGSRTFGIYTDFIIKKDTIRVYNIHLASIRLLPEDIEFVMKAGQEEKKGIKDHAAKIYSKLNEAFLLREKQMEIITGQLKKSPYQVILAGDFNDTPSSFVYQKITQILHDSFKEKGWGLSVTFAGQIPFLRIDYIMTSDHLKTLQYSRHRIDYSDHFPVSAVFGKN
jgi:endonuclease/exonuclease/phosphatase family metal-dependent hydrolase